MPFEDQLPDLFTQNSQRLASTHGWMSPLSAFAIAQSASSPDDAEATAGALRTAHVQNSPDPLGGFFDDGRLYDQAPTKLKVARFLRGKSGQPPVAAQNIRDAQTFLNEQGYGNLPVNGIWGSEWQGAMYEYNQAQREKDRSSGGGKGFSINKALKWLTGTMPAGAADAALGFVKGLPDDLRNVAADLLAGVEKAGYDVSAGFYDQAVNGTSSQASNQYSNQILMGHTAAIKNALGGDTSATKEAEAFGVSLKDLQSTKKTGLGTWDMVHRYAGDIGTVMLLSSTGKAAAGFLDAAELQASRGVTEKAAFRTPKIIGRKLSGLEVANPEVLTMADEMAMPGAISGTFSQGGAAGSQAFKNVTNLSEELPVLRGNYGWHLGEAWGKSIDVDPLGRAGRIWYGLRTLAAGPQIFPSVRIAGDALHTATNFAIRARLTAAASELGPGSNDLARSIQDEHTVQHWNEQNVKQYGALANIDNLMFLFHAQPGTSPVSPGTYLATEVADRNAKIRDAYNSMGIPQAWERFSKISHTESKTWEEFVQGVGGEGRAQRWVNKKLNDYALERVAKEMSLEQGTFADEADALLTANAEKAGTIVPASWDETARATVRREVEQKIHFDMQERMRNDPELLAQAHLRGLSDYEQDSFVKFLAENHNVKYADRTAPARMSWGDHTTDLNSYIDASDIFHRDILPTLQSNITGMAANVGTLNATALDAADNIPWLENTLRDAKEVFNEAKRTERTVLFGERDTAAKATRAAGRAVKSAEDAVVKTYEAEQVLAEKTRIGDVRTGLSSLEKSAKSAETAQATAESKLGSGQSAFAGSKSTLDRAIDLGMTKEEFQAARKEAADAAAALAKKDIEPKTPVKVVRATLAEARKSGTSAYDREIRAKSLEAGGKTSHQVRAADLGMTEAALKTAEDAAVKAARQAAKDAGTPWTNVGKEADKVRTELRRTLSANATSVKPLQTEVEKAVAETASKWAELHAAVADAGATYDPAKPYQTRFAMESRPTMPHPDPSGAIDPALAQTHAAAQAEEALAQNRTVHNWNPRDYRLHGRDANGVRQPTWGRPLAPALSTAEQAVNDAQDALRATKQASKQVDADLNMIGVMTAGKKGSGTIRDIGIQGNETLTHSQANEALAKFRAEADDIAAELQTQRSGGRGQGIVDPPKVEDEYGWDWDMATPAEQAQMRKDFEVYTKIDLNQISDANYKALDITDPPWDGRPRGSLAIVGMSLDDWRSYSDAGQKILTAAAKTQTVPTVPGGVDLLARGADLQNRILAWGFQHFAQGMEQGKAFDGVAGRAALLDKYEAEANRLAKDVILGTGADPRLVQAAAGLDGLGYKLVQGKGLGFLTVPETAADHLEFVRTNWTRQMLTRMGMSSELVLNSTIPVAQQANRFKRYAALATKFARPGVDAKSIEGLMAAIRSDSTDLLKGTEGIAPKSFGSKLASGSLFASGEHARLVNAVGADNARLSDEISNITQLRDMRPRRVIKILTSQTAIDNFFGTNETLGVSTSRVEAFTKAEANAIYRETVKSYSVPFRFAGISQLDNLFRASAQWVGEPGWYKTSAGASVLGAGTGLAVGTARGDDPKTLLKDVAIGAGVGAAIALPGMASARYADSLGWSMANMPNAFKVAANRFRFELSPMFSLRRIVKTNLKLMLEGIPPSLHPLKAIGADAARIARQSEEYKLLDTKNGIQFIQDAKNAAIRDSLETVKRVFPELNNKYADAADDADRFLREQDVFGLYNGRSHEMHAAYELTKQGNSDQVIREKLIHMFTYGREGQIGRSALERSANFIFFPFSFDKTLYRNVGLYLLDRPTQTLMMQQSLAKYNDFSKNHPNTPGASEWIKGHLPLLSEVQRLNAFEHGLSLGELGGINAPLFQLFIPQQWRSTSENVDVLHRYIPVLKDFDRVWTNVKDQMYVGRTALENVSRDAVGTPNYFSNPAKSVLAPPMQLHEAFKYQNKLYETFGQMIADNRKTRDPNRKWHFSSDVRVMGQYHDQEVTSAQIKRMVQDRFPEFDALLGRMKGVENNAAIQDYSAQLNGEGEKKMKATFDDFNKQVSKFGRILQDETDVDKVDYQAMDERLTATFRSQAIWLAKRDPRFYDLYQTVFQRILGPLERVN